MIPNQSRFCLQRLTQENRVNLIIEAMVCRMWSTKPFLKLSICLSNGDIQYVKGNNFDISSIKWWEGIIRHYDFFWTTDIMLSSVKLIKNKLLGWRGENSW